MGKCLRGTLSVSVGNQKPQSDKVAVAQQHSNKFGTCRCTMPLSRWEGTLNGFPLLQRSLHLVKDTGSKNTGWHKTERL
jgi:hypothetical protein